MSDKVPQDIASAPKDGTHIIVSGGWYEFGSGRFDGPSFVAWDDLAGGWIMQDDHKQTYNEPKEWVAAG